MKIMFQKEELLKVTKESYLPGSKGFYFNLSGKKAMIMANGDGIEIGSMFASEGLKDDEKVSFYVEKEAFYKFLNGTKPLPISEISMEIGTSYVEVFADEMAKCKFSLLTEPFVPFSNEKKDLKKFRVPIEEFDKAVKRLSYFLPPISSKVAVPALVYIIATDGYRMGWYRSENIVNPEKVSISIAIKESHLSKLEFDSEIAFSVSENAIRIFNGKKIVTLKRDSVKAPEHERYFETASEEGCVFEVKKEEILSSINLVDCVGEGKLGVSISLDEKGKVTFSRKGGVETHIDSEVTTFNKEDAKVTLNHNYLKVIREIETKTINVSMKNMSPIRIKSDETNFNWIVLPIRVKEDVDECEIQEVTEDEKETEE